MLGHNNVFPFPPRLVPASGRRDPLWPVARIAQRSGRGLSDYVSDWSRVLTGTTPEAPGRSSSSIADHHDEVGSSFTSSLFFPRKTCAIGNRILGRLVLALFAKLRWHFNGVLSGMRSAGLVERLVGLGPGAFSGFLGVSISF